MKDQNAGIDYGKGTYTNRDGKTGIHYGVISQHNLNGDALNDIWMDGIDLDYESYIEELKEQGKTDEEIEEETEFYESDEPHILYEKDGYVIETSSLGIFVTKSPYYTYCKFCSPCAPGAGDLDSPLKKTHFKTYCLGADWFDDEKAPYKIYSLVQKKAIINYYDLTPEWQAEAKSNLGEYAEENMYLEPDEESNPKDHVLWDLSEAMLAKGNHKGFEYNATIGISNNSAMLLKISDDNEEAEYIIV